MKYPFYILEYVNVNFGEPTPPTKQWDWYLYGVSAHGMNVVAENPKPDGIKAFSKAMPLSIGWDQLAINMRAIARKSPHLYYETLTPEEAFLFLL